MQCTPFSSLTHPSPLPLHPTTPSNKQHSINTPIHLTIIRHLRPPAPHDLPPRRHDAQLADIDLDDGPLGQHPELRVQRVLRVFFDGDDGQLDRDAEFGVGDVGFFVAEAHGADEPFVFDGAAGEAGADEGGFGYHAFPAGGCMLVLGGTQDGGEGRGGEKGGGMGLPFLCGFLPCFYDFEHFFLTDALHLRQRHTELRRLLRPFVLDLRTQRLGIIRRLVPIQQI